MNQKLQTRKEQGELIAKKAAALAMEYYRNPSRLQTRNKGLQDQVSDGDVAVEKFIREELTKAFPDDGLIGEEEDVLVPSSSGYTWVIDPIDGTSNFVRSAPGWCVVLCLVDATQQLIGIIHDPIAQESYVAVRGQGCTLNGEPVQVSPSISLADGSVAMGMSNRTPAEQIVRAIERLAAADGLFYRNGSGALMLAYVSNGRLNGYCEPHMNAWDCLAGMLMIEEAGGVVEDFDMATMLKDGGRVIAACPGIYEQIHAICVESYVNPAA